MRFKHSRAKAVKEYFSRTGTPSALRRACLCLRLTLFATAITATTLGADSEPALVRLAKKEVQQRTALLLHDIFSAAAVGP